MLFQAKALFKILMCLAPMAFFMDTNIVKAQEATVRVGILEFPPYSIKQQNKPPTGAVVEIIRATFKQAGLTADIQILPYSRAINYAEDGSFHAVGILNSKTASQLTLSKTHTSTLVQTFFVRASDPWNFSGMASLDSQKVLNIADYNYANVSVAYQHYLDSAPNVFTTVADEGYLGRIAKMISMGRVDVFNEDRLVMSYSLEQNGLTGQLREAGAFPKKLKLYVGFANNKEARQYRQTFDTTFETLLKNGMIDAILQQFGAER